MMEEKPKNRNNVVDFVERQRRRGNELKREKLEESPDGYALYPEEQIEITAQHALELAKSIVLDLDIDSEAERIRKGEINFGIDRDKLASQRQYSQIMSNEKLLKTLSLHEKSPHHYSRELILAVAEELVRRLSSH